MYFAAWYGNKMRVQWPESVRDLVEAYSGETNILVSADFVPDEEFDIFNVPFNPDFSGAGRGLQTYDGRPDY